MAFKFKNTRGTTYFLHSRNTTLKNGTQQVIYFFSKEEAGAIDNLPAGYEVSETRNGLPVLKRTKH